MIFYVDSNKPVEIPAECRQELEKYRKQSKKLRIMITPVFQLRTPKQNAIFHAKINELSELTGADRDYIKDEIKQQAISMGYPVEIGDDGEPRECNGRLVPISTASATIEQMKILIQALDMWCLKHDINIGELWNE